STTSSASSGTNQRAAATGHAGRARSYSPACAPKVSRRGVSCTARKLPAVRPGPRPAGAGKPGDGEQDPPGAGGRGPDPGVGGAPGGPEGEGREERQHTEERHDRRGEVHAAADRSGRGRTAVGRQLYRRHPSDPPGLASCSTPRLGSSSSAPATSSRGCLV